MNAISGSGTEVSEPRSGKLGFAANISDVRRKKAVYARVVGAANEAQPVLECGDSSPLSADDSSPSSTEAREDLRQPLERGLAWPPSRPSPKSGDKSSHSIKRPTTWGCDWTMAAVARPPLRHFLAFAFLAVVLSAAVSCRHRGQEKPAEQSDKVWRVADALKTGRFHDFRLAEDIPGRVSRQCTFTNAAWILKLEVFAGLDKESAQTLLNEGLMNVEALYANALSPYPGDISHQLVANQKFRPQRFQTEARGRAYHYYILFANGRLGYGATAEDLLKHKSLLGWFHCEPSGNFYKVRVFSPMGTETRELERMFLNLECP